MTATTGRMARDLQEFERRCDLLREVFAIPGMSIAVVQAQELILAPGFGIVDLAEGTPAAADTPYPVASLTKTFAAAVIMRLVEAGKLDLDDGELRSGVRALVRADQGSAGSQRLQLRRRTNHGSAPSDSHRAGQTG